MRQLIVLGVRRTPDGLYLDGFHVYLNGGQWLGVYASMSRAVAEVAALKAAP